jgi:hypothetical protein
MRCTGGEGRSREEEERGKRKRGRTLEDSAIQGVAPAKARGGDFIFFLESALLGYIPLHGHDSPLLCHPTAPSPR